MQAANIKKIDNKNILFLILLAGSILRIANLGTKDLWYDEILTFSLASDNISFQEFFHLANSLDGTPIFFNFFLKIIFKILPYDVIYIKLFLVFFSIASIISVSYLALLITSNKSYLLATFLVSFNVFLIDYCSELRIYNFIFFISSLSLIFFFKFYNNRSKSNFIYFTLITTLNSFLHPLNLIITFSYIFFLIIKFLNNKILYKKIVLSIILILFFNLIYYYFYFIFSENYKVNTWIQNVRFDFFYQYFFPNFFGSKVLGILFLINFLYLIYKNFIFLKNDKYLFLIILVGLTYILPLIFSFLFKPILIPRYIIFILIPIILLISSFLYNLKNYSVRKKLTFFSILLILLNSLLEAPIKKIYDQNYSKKPEFIKTINLIGNSNYKNYSLLFSHNLLTEKKKEVLRIYEIYLDSLIKSRNIKINFAQKDFENNKKNKYWLICDYSINSNNCELNAISRYRIIKNIDLYKINLKLVELVG